MAIYRAYRQPGIPFQGIYRPARIGDGDDGEYSDELKSKCDAAAGPRPPCPTSCLTPTCKVRHFYSRVTYKEDYAAAQVFVVSLCGVPRHVCIANFGAVRWLRPPSVPRAMGTIRRRPGRH